VSPYQNIQEQALIEHDYIVCIRNEVVQRSVDAGLSTLYLPQLSTKTPKEPHVPIFATPQAELKTKKRIVVVLNDHKQDLGVWDYRYLSTHGIDAGSCVNLVKGLNNGVESSEAFGLVISNPGQLTYSHKYRRAMTLQSWQAMPRASLAHPATQEHPVYNSAEGNRNKAEHLTFIFERILKDSAWARQDAEIYIIGILNGGEEVLSYLNKNWNFWAPRVAGIALTSVFTKRQTLSWEFIQFLRDRARNWKISGAPKDACLVSPLHWTLQIPDTSNGVAPPDLTSSRLPTPKESAPGSTLEQNSTADPKTLTTNLDHPNPNLNPDPLYPRLATQYKDRSQPKREESAENGVVAPPPPEEELIEWSTNTQPTDPLIPDPQLICPEFSSSVTDFTDIIFPTVLDSVLAFFNDVQKDSKHYKNPAFAVTEWEPEIAEAPVPELDFGKEEGVETMVEGEKQSDVVKVAETETVVVQQFKNGTAETAKQNVNDTATKITTHAKGPQITIASVDMDKEMLEAAGLM
jgi:hypothetical protein